MDGRVREDKGMTRYEEIKNNINYTVSYFVMLSKGHSLCGNCETDRKICNAEINQNCAKQYLMGERYSDFKCDYKKY